LIPRNVGDSSLHIVQAGSEAHPTSYPMRIVGSSPPAVKQPGSETSEGAEFKNIWNYTSTPAGVFVVGCLINYRDGFTDRSQFRRVTLLRTARQKRDSHTNAAIY
jgi:hypothetical protein